MATAQALKYESPLHQSFDIILFKFYSSNSII
jgi:hypothetical protein